MISLPNLTQILSLNNNLDHICHVVSPFSLPTVFFDGSALHIDLVFQRIVTQSAGSSAAGGAGNHVAGNAVHLAADEGSGPGGIGNSSLVVAVCLAIECMGCSAGGTEHLLLLALQITFPVFFCIFTNGAIWSPSTFLFYLLQCCSSTGDCCFMGLCLNFYCGGRCRCGEWASPFWT